MPIYVTFQLPVPPACQSAVSASSLASRRPGSGLASFLENSGTDVCSLWPLTVLDVRSALAHLVALLRLTREEHLLLMKGCSTAVRFGSAVGPSFCFGEAVEHA